MLRAILWAGLAMILAGGSAYADSLTGSFGIYGKGGALVPLKDDFVSSTSKTKTGFATGGGVILGVARNLALEVDVTEVPSLDVEISGAKAYKATLIDVAPGFQFRIGPDRRIVPFVGAGLDFITGDLTHVSGAGYDLEWTEGAHVNAGFDYFVTRYVTLTVDTRGILAFKGDVKSGGTKVGEYRPNSFLATLGIRLILPQSAFR